MVSNKAAGLREYRMAILWVGESLKRAGGLQAEDRASFGQTGRNGMERSERANEESLPPVRRCEASGREGPRSTGDRRLRFDQRLSAVTPGHSSVRKGVVGSPSRL